MRVPVPIVAASAAAMISAGCESSPATVAGPGPATASSSSGRPAHACGQPLVPTGQTLTLTRGNSGQTYCVAAGSRILVYLKGTPAERWSPIRVSSGALRPAASGHLMLALGVTGASFVASGTGIALITSVQPLCDSNVPPRAGTAASAPPHCTRARSFRVTVLVSQEGPGGKKR
jgi:hypothetical protein